jgi:hypothetical protein
LGSQSRPAADAETTELFLSAIEATNDNSTVLLLAQEDTPSKPAAASKSDDGKPVLVLKYGDGKADGKKSLGGNGEMIHFELPDKQLLRHENGRRTFSNRPTRC